MCKKTRSEPGTLSDPIWERILAPFWHHFGSENRSRSGFEGVESARALMITPKATPEASLGGASRARSARERPRAYPGGGGVPLPKVSKQA